MGRPREVKCRGMERDLLPWRERCLRTGAMLCRIADGVGEQN